MEVYTFDPQDANIREFRMRDQLISAMKKRFSLYGYQEIRTSAFEPYELYSNDAGTIPQVEMIKVIDRNGKVLVLRPDVTIPVTQEVAARYDSLPGHIRYFYVMDVFRQSFDGNGSKERTQAGIECFGEKSAEIDAEAIALAIQTLKDLGVRHFKIEIGHANFFKEVVQEMQLSGKELDQLKKYIQAKNMIEIGPFLENLSVEKHIADAVSTIPFLYGKPEDVLAKAKKIALNDTMREELESLMDVYGVLQAYGVEDHIVFDLGLINHMDYYSDIIFQGFIDNVAKPVLMGGRYDRLAEQFDSAIPAIGFACDVEALLEGTKEELTQPVTAADLTIIYEKTKQQEAFDIASRLREEGYRTIAVLATERTQANSPSIIQITEKENVLISGNDIRTFEQIADLKDFL